MAEPRPPEPVEAGAVKACCTALYAHPLAVALLGEFFHPGGAGLTRRLLDCLELQPGECVLDVAAGRGATALLVAERHGCRVVAVEQSAELAAAARRAAAGADLGDRVEVLRGDAEALPVPAASVDAVVCECALCTFSQPEVAVAEWLRALRPGGRLGLADVTRQGVLPEALDSALARAACLAGARSQDGYQELLAAGGFEVSQVEAHDHALRELAKEVQGKLLAVEVLHRLGRIALPADLLGRGRELLRQAQAAIADGRLGYSLFIGRKPQP